MRPLRAAPLLLLGLSHATGAQIVRGIVTERTTAQPIPGVLVSLERQQAADAAAGQPIANALTNERGEYALRGPAAGGYRVSAKRIGVSRYVSPFIRLGAGETRRHDIQLDPASHVLPEVPVVAEALCSTRREQARRLASLWDEAGTALTALQISLRERLFRASLYRYTRELEPNTLRVVTESRREAHGLFERPFRSLPPDSLARTGFWVESGDTASYFAPDADVLLAPAFLRTHCFTVVEGEGRRRDMVGLRFDPARGAHRRDIRGTLWLDARTFELRLVEFAFTGLPRAAASSGIGGEVRFAHLPNGAWAARRWFLRMPRYATFREFGDTRLGRTARVEESAGVYRIVEEGGDVFAEGIRFFDTPATIVGTVADSASQPLPGAMVRLGGSPFSTVADALGAFRFDSLPSGAYTLIAEHPAYDAFGMPASSLAFELEEGAVERVNLRAASSAQIVERLCEHVPRQRNRGTLRLSVRHADTREPLAMAPVHLFWLVAADGKPPDGIRTRTDGEGRATFCNVPAGPRLLFSVLLSSLAPGPIQSQCRVGRNQVIAREVLARRPTAAADRYQDTLGNLPVCYEVNPNPNRDRNDDPVTARRPARPPPNPRPNDHGTFVTCHHPCAMNTDVILKAFERPDEHREFAKGKFELVTLGGMTIGRATYEPGWKWSQHVGPGVGKRYCEVEHVGLVLSGTATAAFEDGRVVELRAGELFYIPPVPHDSWVVGDEPYVSLHFVGAERYANK